MDLLVTNDTATPQSAHVAHVPHRVCDGVVGAAAIQDDHLPEVLRSQVAALRKSIGKGWHVLAAVHGDSPSIADAMREVEALGIDRLIVIPMHPQFGSALGAAQLDELYACLRRMKLDLHIEVRSSWHDDAAFIDAAAHRLHAFATSHGLSPRNSVLVFQARAPQGNGDRYRSQVAATAELVRERLGWPANLAATVYGDVGTTACCLEDLTDQVDAIDPSGARSVIGCPISDLSRRACEHSVCQAAYRAVLGVRNVQLCPAANDAEEFIKALAQLVRRPRHSAYDLTHAPEPLFPNVNVSADVTREVGSLFMVGMETTGAMGRGQGPLLHYSSPADFRAVKRPHLETIDLLRHAAQCSDVRECWIWNTCTRYEFYGWFPVGATARSRQQTIDAVKAMVFPTADPSRINVLTGPAARAHMLRTASGLNSHLIGDAEVVDQLDASRRAAEHAGSAGQLSNDLVDDTIDAVRLLRQETAWRNLDNRYCATVLARLAERLADPIARGQIMVIGGSTTSCSILETLIKDFRVPRERLSLIYRGRRKGALVRRLHNATGEGQVTIVESYTDPAVLGAIARSDLVFLGIDQREPIASGTDLVECRDLCERPLTVLDFNTFGSITASPLGGGVGRGGRNSLGAMLGLDFLTAQEIDAGIDAFNGDATAKPDFAGSLASAESWIARHCGYANADAADDSDPTPTATFPVRTSLCESAS
jgi:protoheme ferro-lyase